MANNLKDTPISGGISFKSPIFSFGNSVPDINSGFNFDLPLAAIQSFADRALDFSSNNSARNQAFITSTQKLSQTSIDATTGQVIGVQKQSLGVLQQMSGSLQEILTPSRGGCFITTAICDTMQLPDDCEYLTLLRDFRDNVMRKNDRWSRLVDQYYEIAPDIVARINIRPDRAQIYLTLRDDFLLPCVENIKQGYHSEAIILYREMVFMAEALANGDE